jgi:DNA polymerase sigma
MDALKPIKLNVVTELGKILKNSFEYEINIEIYGSFACDICIESSDIDLKVVIINPESHIIDYDRIIFCLVNYFNEKKIFEKVTPINTASIPIIKLVIKLIFYCNY